MTLSGGAITATCAPAAALVCKNRQPTTSLRRTGTGGRATVNVRAGWQVLEHLEVRFAVESMFDTAYREHGSGIDAPGINAIIGLQAFW